MSGDSLKCSLSGGLKKAPEGFLSASQIAEVAAGRRGFLRGAFTIAAGGAAVLASVAGRAEFFGDPNILELPLHTKSLGRPVAETGYGQPSQYERNLQRRESPGLTRVPAASVSFAPLQGMFGIITPNGLHFERHHQGWWDIDPSKHRLMINGLVKNPLVFTMDDLMRLPAVSRIHFIECGANTGMEWGNVAVPTVQYTHGMLSCCEFTGVLLSTLLDIAGFDKKKRQVYPCRRCRWFFNDAHHRYRPSSRRLPGGVRHEWRNVAPGKRVSVADGGAGRSGRFMGEVAAANQSG